MCLLHKFKSLEENDFHSGTEGENNSICFHSSCIINKKIHWIFSFTFFFNVSFHCFTAAAVVLFLHFETEKHWGEKLASNWKVSKQQHSHQPACCCCCCFENLKKSTKKTEVKREKATKITANSTAREKRIEIIIIKKTHIV